MNLYLQCCSGALIALILILTLGSKGREGAVLLALAACCMTAVAALSYLEPVMDFVNQIRVLGGLDSEMISIGLQKAVHYILEA